MLNNWTIIEFDEIDSTNTYLKKNSESYEHRTVIRANYQSHGRGQFDRTWDSQPGRNLLCSILFKGNFPFPSTWMNPIIIQTLLTLLKEYGIHAYYKSPNDIYVGNQKIAGILMETKYEDHLLQTFILGIGLNVNQEEFPETLNATSMWKLTDHRYDLNEVLKRLLFHLENYLNLGKLIYEESSYT